jgi:uncharacterized protein (DUF305 family)
MKSSRIPVTVLAAGLLACHGTPQQVQTVPRPAEPAMTREESLRAAIAKAAADSVRHPYTKADIDFMTGMISHHAQAILMARWAPTHGASPAVQTLCSRIINAQTDEINLMSQ